MRKLNQTGFGATGAVLAIIIIGLIGAVGWLVYDRQKQQPTQTSSPATQQISEQAEQETIPAPQQKGTIKGTASYPSERLPEDEEVCAEDISDKSKTYCMNVGKSNAAQFELAVPAGTYHVYAKTAKLGKYRAYYNEYVKCGLSAGCAESGHKQYIAVKVEAGEVVDRVDPGDWYDTSQ